MARPSRPRTKSRVRQRHRRCQRQVLRPRPKRWAAMAITPGRQPTGITIEPEPLRFIISWFEAIRKAWAITPMKALSAQAKTRIAAFIFRFPIPLALWGQIEKLAAIAQGKGWGMSSINQEVNACLSLLGREPDIICDVGANRGDYSWKLLRRYGHGQFFLFEPSATNLSILLDRYRAFPQVKIFPVALCDQQGSAILFASTPGSGEASLSEVQGEDAATKMEHQESVATERLDTFADELTQNGSRCIDLVKIDVEGHELGACCA